MENPETFTTNYTSLLARVRAINPILYGRTRNNINGSVTKISPYLTHGVISLPLVRAIVLEKYSAKEAYPFIFELAWREFFQRVYGEEGMHIYSDIKRSQVDAVRSGIPTTVISATTGIVAIDTAYRELYVTGYMHNHARLWSAMLITNVGHYKWWDSSRHLFYHLLDGDKASNTLSWQWVAGTFSAKQYIANQEMINLFAEEKQHKTYLDADTYTLLQSNPAELRENLPFTLSTDFHLFENAQTLSEIQGEHILLYSIWTLDPTWSPADTAAIKILFVDKEELTQFPISPKRIEFIQRLAKNITDIQIILGTLEELSHWAESNKDTTILYRKNHPALLGWPGIVSQPEYLFPQIPSVPRGFMSFWKKCEKYLY